MLTLANFACVALIVTEIILNRLLRSNSSDKKREDKHSTGIIWLAMFLVILLSVFISRFIHLPIYLNARVQYLGVLIIFLAIIFRLLAVFSLGKFFTVDVAIREDHRLKKDGLYKYLRHPAYLASLMSFIGMAWTFNNWISLFLMTVTTFMVLNHRIRIEEQVLTEHFGVEYLDYQRTTRKIIPFIY
ncbi:MAG: isoprenylcysteine carboxylmethyltransferase family protein [Chitinophagaceae bacterium]|nr:MAG: isoprenylcysteine carboxylmethyltransferase family protein [Chitinophagaceae bacterium]